MADKDGKTYVPRQHVRRGVAGYRGDNLEIVDKDGKKVAAKKKKIVRS